MSSVPSGRCESSDDAAANRSWPRPLSRLLDGHRLAVDTGRNGLTESGQDRWEEIHGPHSVLRPATVGQGRHQHVIAVQAAVRTVVRLVLEPRAQIESV